VLRVHRLGAAELFAWPGALPRIVEKPARALALPGWLARAECTFAQIASPSFSRRPVDEIIAHWLVPSAFPLGARLAGVLPPHTPQPPALEVVAHGSDVRVLVALPAPIRRAIVRALLARDARFRFVGRSLLHTLCDSLPTKLADRLQARAYVEPLPLALDPETIARARRRGDELRETISRGVPRPIWISCGRLITGKGLDLALDRASVAGAHWIVVGDGPERARLERETSRRGVAAHFTGLLDHDEALAWIAASDRLIQFSRAEGAPSAVREARALGVRVLASPTAGDAAEWASSDPGIEVLGDDCAP
jgi:glycosyltransferase involved in cell wall biosynthesis